MQYWNFHKFYQAFGQRSTTFLKKGVLEFSDRNNKFCKLYFFWEMFKYFVWVIFSQRLGHAKSMYVIPNIGIFKQPPSPVSHFGHLLLLKKILGVWRHLPSPTHVTLCQVFGIFW